MGRQSRSADQKLALGGNRRRIYPSDEVSWSATYLAVSSCTTHIRRNCPGAIMGGQTGKTPPERFAGALYYPHIHVTDVNWLRANLLIFPHVQRMMPYLFVPDRDHPAVRSFTETYRGDYALLHPAKLFSKRAINAQEGLRQRLILDSQDSGFLEHFGKKAARAKVAAYDFGFQIHAGKLHPPLVDALSEGDRLAWKPVRTEPSLHSDEYLELHPRVGQVVMSTLAIACAQGAGLHVVGDKRSGDLHHTLIARDLDGLYDAWLHPERDLSPPAAPSATRLFEHVIGFASDVSSLSAKKILALTENREPIEALLSALARDASTIAAMDPGNGASRKTKCLIGEQYP